MNLGRVYMLRARVIWPHGLFSVIAGSIVAESLITNIFFLWHARRSIFIAVFQKTLLAIYPGPVQVTVF